MNSWKDIFGCVENIFVITYVCMIMIPSRFLRQVIILTFDSQFFRKSSSLFINVHSKAEAGIFRGELHFILAIQSAFVSI